MKKKIVITIDDHEVGGVTSVVSNMVSLFQTSRNFIYEVISIDGIRKKSFLKFLITFNNSIRSSNTIIHLNSPKSFFVASCIPSFWFRKKIITFHGSQYLELKNLMENWVFNTNFIVDLKYFFLEKWLFVQQFLSLFFVNKIVVLSNYSKKVLLKNFPFITADKVVVIPGYVDFESIQKVKTKKIGVENTLVLLFIGRADPRKGLTLLLEAGAILNKKNIDFKIYISSPVLFYQISKDLHFYEKNNLFDKVHFLHCSNKEQKEYLYKRADLFIMCSKNLETFGMTTIESLAHGLPVIGTPTGATPEILSKIDSRLLAKSTSGHGLANRIMWYMSLSNKEKKKIINKGINVVSEYYSIEAVKEKIFDLYD